MTEKTELQQSQARLDDIQGRIIANKVAREELRDEAKTLRNQYIAEEKVRERLLKETLQGGNK